MGIVVSTLIFLLSHEETRDPSLRAAVVFWDTQTGIIVKTLDGIHGKTFVRIEYSGDGGTINAIQDNQTFHTYHGQNYGKLCSGLLLPPRRLPGALWAERESVRFSTSHKSGRYLVIEVHEIQPTSIPPLRKLESLPVPFRQGKLYFSPACFCASIVAENEVIILDVRSSKVLFEKKTAQPSYKKFQGRFSPDGRFFICEALTQDICMWENESTRFVPKASLRPRSALRSFKFSPNATSILCWNEETIQLLDPDIRFTPPTPHDSALHHQHGDHIVARSTTNTYIAIARRGQSSVILFDSCSLDTPRRFINAGMEIQDVKIVGETVFVADTYRLASWSLGAGVVARGETIEFGTDTEDVDHLALSMDCSRVFFVANEPETEGPPYHLSVQDSRTGATLAKSRIGFDVGGIGFFPDGHRAWLIEKNQDADQGVESDSYGKWVWGIARGEDSVETEPERVDEWPAGCPWISPGGYCIVDGGRWVMDSGRKLHLLWLPPDWRTERERDTVWDGDFLTLLGDRLEPVIIEFFSQPYPLDSSVRFSDDLDSYSPSDADPPTTFI